MNSTSYERLLIFAHSSWLDVALSTSTPSALLKSSSACLARTGSQPRPMMARLTTGTALDETATCMWCRTGRHQGQQF